MRVIPVALAFIIGLGHCLGLGHHAAAAPLGEPFKAERAKIEQRIAGGDIAGARRLLRTSASLRPASPNQQQAKALEALTGKVKEAEGWDRLEQTRRAIDTLKFGTAYKLLGKSQKAALDSTQRGVLRTLGKNLDRALKKGRTP